MKILFSNPAWFEQDNGHLRQGIRAGSRWPFTRHAWHAPDQYRFGGYLPAPFFMEHAAAWTARALPEAHVVLRDSIARGESYNTFFEHIAEEHYDFIVVETATPSWPHDEQLLERFRALSPGSRIILTGTLPCEKSAEIFAAHPNVIAIVQGEYDKQIAAVIRSQVSAPSSQPRLWPHDLLTVDELNAAPFPMVDPACEGRYWDACPAGQQAPHLQIWTSRGCPYKCLSGDTPINTVEGMVPIRELVGRTIGVFTYDQKERRAKIATVSDIRKTGERQKLVRVRFDDGSHLDCTPDHQLMVFKWGNQHVPEREWLVEAQDLKPGQRIRSLSVYKSHGYPVVVWNRDGRKNLHRMVAEWKMGRALKKGECVHHIDHDKANWHPDNLAVMSSAKEHFAAHPEIAQRMREHNPTARGVNDEWRGRIAAANRGKVRSMESRERYRQAAILREAKKSPEQKRRDLERMVAGTLAAKPWLSKERSALGQFNHKVVSVEELPGEHETFCMEVPETHLFFANNLLARNCIFCVWPAVMTGHDPDGTRPRKVRCHSPQWVEAMIRERLAAAAKLGIHYKSIYLDDDTANLTDKHTLAMCEVMKRIGLPWSAMCRVDTISHTTWRAMKESGCFGVKLGFESGSQHVIDHIVNKRLDLAKAENETLPFLQSLGLTIHTTWTVGLPGETPAQQQETLRTIERFYEKKLHQTHQLSGTAEIEGTPLHTLRTAEKLAKYDGATLAGASAAESDGQKKIERITR